MVENRLIGMITEDPLADLPVGAKFDVEPIVFATSDATALPTGLTNWTFFEGSVMILLVKTKTGVKAMGTVVGIAPGLAITATHVFRDDLDAIMMGEVALLCGAPRSSGLDFWRVKKVRFRPDDDIAYLSLALASPIYDAWRVHTIPMTTRQPAIGELLHVVGFRMLTIASEGFEFGLEGELLASLGEVVAVHYPQRDRVILPFPCIEISCGALGGMSGGAVLDAAGHLTGVVSSSLGTDDGGGPTFAAWVLPALNHTVEIPWPPGVYRQPIHLLDIDPRLLRIEGRERVTIVDKDHYTYQSWS